LKKWVRLGCFVQVTGGSLTGGFGPGAQQDSMRWIGEGLVHFVASDAHNTRTRPLRLQPAFDVVKSHYGKEKAQALFRENPWAAFEGRELPHVPEIADEPYQFRKKKRFFFF
jgi:protein-tyrosine phosphatase